MAIDRAPRFVPVLHFVLVSFVFLALWNSSSGAVNGTPAPLDPETVRARIAQHTKAPGWESEAIPGRLFVHFREKTGPPDRARAVALAGPRAQLEATNRLTGGSVLILDPEVSLGEALGRLANDPAVAWAEPIWQRRLATTLPNDARFAAQWALRNTGQASYGTRVEDSNAPGTPGADIDAPAAWNRRTNADTVVVAIVDTGVDLAHPDLVANLWTNPGEIPGDGLDNDGNGYADDIHGYDFAAGRDDGHLLIGPDPTDIDGHGTAVAGAALARGHNERGVAGVAWSGRFMALKIMTPQGTMGIDSIVLALDYAVANGARVVNVSFVGDTYSHEEFLAVQRLAAAGVLLVAATGNDNLDLNRAGNTIYPVGYDLPNIVGVGATQRNDLLASFSNYGSAITTLAAPGEAILTTLPNYNPSPSGGGTANNAFPRYDDDRNGHAEYGVVSGTSFAAPMVSGAAALLLADRPGLTPAQVVERLALTGDRPVSLSPAATRGGGRLNLAQLLDFANPYVAYVEPPVFVPGETRHAVIRGTNFQPGATVEFPGTSIAATVRADLSTETALHVELDVPMLGEPTARPVAVVVRHPGGDAFTRPEAVVVQERGFVFFDTPSTPVPIPDNTGQSVVRTLSVPRSGVVADLDLKLDILHTWVGDLHIVLTGPDGTPWTVVNRPGYAYDGSSNIRTWYPSASYPYEPLHPFAGKPIQGNWTLTVTDRASLDMGTLRGWALRLVARDSWAFASAVPIFAAPAPEQGDGFLSLRSPGSNSAFGYWQTAPNLSFPHDTFFSPTAFLRATATLSTPTTDPDRVPLYRLRLNTDDAQLALLQIMQRNGPGGHTPTPEGRSVEWLAMPPDPNFIRQKETPRFEFAFDLVNFDDRMDPTGELRLRDLRIETVPRLPAADWRFEHQYTFQSGTEGWFSATAAEFVAPTFTHTNQRLGMVARNSTNTFGIWTSPTTDVALDPERLYRLRYFVVGTSALGKAATLRLRAGDALHRHGTALVVNSMGDWAYAPESTGRNYDLYYAPPPEAPYGLGLEAAFDMLNFDPDDDPEGALYLLSLTVHSAPRP